MKKTIAKKGNFSMRHGTKILREFRGAFPNAELVTSSVQRSPKRWGDHYEGNEKRRRVHVYTLPGGAISINQTAVYEWIDESYEYRSREWVCAHYGDDSHEWGTEEKRTTIPAGRHSSLGIKRITISLNGSVQFVEDKEILRKLEAILRGGK